MTSVRVSSFRNSSGQTEDSHRRFVQNAAELIEDTVNQKAFLEAIKKFPFTSRRFHSDIDGVFTSPTNDQIVETIVSGRERKTDPDDLIDLEIELKSLGDHETGRVSPPNPTIAININYFTSWHRHGEIAILASTIVHEWMHVCGFRHDGGDIDTDDVPYGIGKLVLEFSGGSSTIFPLSVIKRIFNAKSRRQGKMRKEAIKGLHADVIEELHDADVLPTNHHSL